MKIRININKNNNILNIFIVYIITRMTSKFFKNLFIIKI